MGILEVLFVVFLVLKLTGVIAWSWWLVCAPLYPALVIYIILFFILGTIAVSGTLDAVRIKRKRK